MSPGDAIVLAVVLLLMSGAIISLVRSHLSGKCSCGCENCNGCGSRILEIEDERR